MRMLARGWTIALLCTTVFNQCILAEEEPEWRHQLKAATDAIDRRDFDFALKQLLDLLERLKNPRTVDEYVGLDNCVSDIALIDQLRGQLDFAEKFYSASLQLRRKVLNSDNPLIAERLEAIADIMVSQRRFSEAEQLLRDALKIRELHKVKSPEALFSTSSQLAIDLIHQGKLEDAEVILKGFLSILDSPRSEINQRQASTLLNNLGLLEQSRENWGKSETYYRQALGIIEGNPESQRLSSISPRRNLSMVLLSTGQLDEAEALLKTNISIGKREYGPVHPYTLQDMQELSRVLNEKGEVEEAEKLAVQVLDQTISIYGNDHLETAVRQANLATMKELKGQLKEAVTLYETAAKTLAKYPLGNQELVRSKLHIARILFYYENNKDSAEKLLKEAVAITKSPESTDMIKIRSMLACIKREKGQVNEAASDLENLLKVQKTKSQNDINVALMELDLSRCYQKLGRKAEAKLLAEKSLDGQYHCLGKNHPLLSPTYDALLAMCVQNGDSKGAAKWQALRDALYRSDKAAIEGSSIVSKVWSYTAQKTDISSLLELRKSLLLELQSCPNHQHELSALVLPVRVHSSRVSGAIMPQSIQDVTNKEKTSLALQDATIRCLLFNGLVLENAERNAEAFQQYDSAAHIAELAYGDSSPEVAILVGLRSRALRAQGELKSALEDSAKAERLWESFSAQLIRLSRPPAKNPSSVEISSQIHFLDNAQRLGGYHDTCMLAAHWLIECAKDEIMQGRLDKAKSLADTVVQTMLNLAILPKADDQDAKSLTRASELYFDLCEVGKSRVVVESILELNDKAKHDSLQVNAARLHLANVCALQNDFVSSLKNCENVLNSSSSNEKQKSTALQMKAAALIALNRSDDAAQCLERSFKVSLDAQGRAKMCLLEAKVRIQTSDYGPALSAVQRGLSCFSGKDSADTPELRASLYRTKAIVELQKSNTEEAHKNLLEAVAIDKQVSTSESNLNQALDYALLSMTFPDGADRSHAVLDSVQAFRHYIQHVLPRLSLGEQCDAVVSLKEPLSIIVQNCSARDAEEIYSLLICWKGILTANLRQESFKLQRNDDPQVTQLKTELKEIRRQLYETYSHTTEVPTSEWRKSVDALTHKKESVERLLANYVDSGPGDFASFVDAAKFKALLPENHVVVDFYKTVSPGWKENESHYVAFVVDRNSITKITLGSAAEIEKCLSDWLKVVQSQQDDAQCRKKASELLWHPIASTLPAGITHIWISPDEFVARVPVEVLCDIDAPVVTYVDSPRELIRLRNTELLKMHEPSSLLAGGINYSSMGIPNLPGTDEEVKQISAIASAHQQASTLLLAENASKQNILSRLPLSSTVHIAAHGFCSSIASMPKPWKDALGITALDRSIPMPGFGSRNPLLESGLLLSLDKASQDKSSSRLLAEDVIGLDLTHCQLITLSACDTARGDEISGQGVMGFRSALLAAGCRNLLLSLWKVPDDSTRALMLNFYNNMWDKGMDKYSALKLARKQLLEEPSGKYKAPINWAAWIIIGEN